MPPIRSFTLPKPSKTERTHEENQERAYIAASRRSDRSLEARIESARRASEIHKKRTGRSLRVTEQDVVNEEMYEEEDDDLPMQYRRLAATLNGAGNTDLNKRIAAYMTNSVAMRHALGSAMYETYQPGQYPQQMWQQPPFQQQWNADPQQMMMNNSMFMNQQMPQQTQNQGQMMAPQLPQRPSHTQTHRQAPYPTPGSHNYRPNIQQQRSASVAGPSPQAEMSSANSQTPSVATDRRASVPAGQAASSPQPNAAPSPSRTLQAEHKSHSDTSLPTLASHSQSTGDQINGNAANGTFPWSNAMPTPGMSPMAQGMSISPLSMTLPANAQMFLDPQSMLGDGSALSEKPVKLNYSYNPNLKKNKKNATGINQTLAPSHFHEKSMPTPTSSSTDDDFSSHTPEEYAFDNLSKDDPFSLLNNDLGEDMFSMPNDQSSSFINFDDYINESSCA